MLNEAMPDAVTVEDLSKLYVIGHQRAERPTFREMLVRQFQDFARRGAAAFRGSQLMYGSEMEEFSALSDLSFKIEFGEVVGVIGANGAGKSTLLKILSRITEPTTGTIRLRGRVASMLEVGTGFHPELTGRENIFLNGAILGMTKQEIRTNFDAIVAFADIERFLDTPVKRYSSGMYIRLAFAVAAHLSAEILIIDEVLAVGDHEFQKKCLGKLGAVAREGRTVLFVSHNMQAVRALCSRAMVLNRGRQVFDGAPAEAIEQYVHGRDEAVAKEWHRPADQAVTDIGFQAIAISLVGEQPQLKLKCVVELQCPEPTSPSFVAVDIRDHFLAPIMQAVPVSRPFIEGRVGSQRITIEIDLPPLIPGTYYADFWIGHHYSRTCDFVGEVLTFEVSESPAKGRSFPHTIDHGSIATTSRIVEGIAT